MEKMIQVVKSIKKKRKNIDIDRTIMMNRLKKVIIQIKKKDNSF